MRTDLKLDEVVYISIIFPNSALGNKNDKNLTFQVQDGERIISEPKAVASKFNKFFATIGCRIARKLCSVSKDAWKGRLEEIGIFYPD